MSPSRRDFFAVMAGGALSLAATAPIMAAELTEHEQLMDIRDAVERLRDAHDFEVEEALWGTIHVAGSKIGEAIMALCPHDPADYHAHEDHYEVVCCPSCRADTDDPEMWKAFSERQAARS